MGGLESPLDRAEALDRLTERELTVLAHIAQGWSDTAIAAELGLSPRTVASHTHNLLRKLELPRGADVNRRVLAAALYLERRWVSFG